MQKKYVGFVIFILSLLLSGCGFHLTGEMQLAPPLHRLYLQTSDPYGQLARTLKEALKMSSVTLVSAADQADTVLAILGDSTGQHLLGVNSTQQTRQYDLTVTVTFDISDNKGKSLIPVQELSAKRTITIQSNQILGSSNEANLFYQQMRRSLAYSIMNRIASREITQLVNASFIKPVKKKP